MGSVPLDTNCFGLKSTRCQNRGFVGTGWCIVAEIEESAEFGFLESGKVEKLFTEPELSKFEFSNAELPKTELSFIEKFPWELACAELS
jgi:hypothetical protein